MSSIDVTDPRDSVAVAIWDKWWMLNSQRRSWLARGERARAYLSSTSIDTTEAAGLPWKNRTTIPKLAQIAEQLMAFYMAGLMPTDDWIRWEGADKASHEKANLIERYMQTKLRMGKFREELEKIVRDWVIYGNCFAGVCWEHNTTKSLTTGDKIVNFVGPKIFRISPLDCVIDPRARNFDESPFIYRKKMTLGKFIEKYKDTKPQLVADVQQIRGSDSTFMDWYKERGLQVDGFESFIEHLNSPYVEILEYWGDLFVTSTGDYFYNKKITIVDRTYVLENTDNPSWNGKKPFAHTGWRVVPDNLYGIGPLDNLVGMQYRVDHLENLKADTFDQIVHPPIVIKGDNVEDSEWGPGAKWYVGTDGDVIVLRPDATVLQADNQIAIYHNIMDEMAGVPREMRGFRTPGEKTAFEMQVLQQGADRMFFDKLNHFEEQMISDILNIAYELLGRNMDVTDVARTFNNDTRALELTTLTREDIVANGIFRPIGAKHFEARNKRIQELQNLLLMTQNPLIAPHMSGLAMAEAFQEELGFEKYGIFAENIAVREQAQTQVVQLQAQQAIQSAQGGMQNGGQEQEEGIENNAQENG